MSVPISQEQTFTTTSGPRPEMITVAFLNTRFGDALIERDTLPIAAGHLVIVGFSEVTPGIRGQTVEAIEARGYTAAIPEGEGENVDTLWVVSPRLKIDSEATRTHAFSGRIASRLGKRQKRDAGMQTIVVTSPDGHRLRANTERLAPPIIGRRARYRQIGCMATILDEHMPLDPSIALDINGGNQNHANGPGETDKALWGPRGYEAVLQEGTPTYTLDKGSKTAKMIAWMFGVVRKKPGMHFDEMYLRPGLGSKLAPGHMLSIPGQIGRTTEVLPVSGTDHHAIVTTLTFPWQAV